VKSSSPSASSGKNRLGTGSMFDAIAGRYDLLNRVMSMGIDQYWRRRTVAALELEPGARVLDLGTGTADLAMRMARSYPDAHVVGLDPSANMLSIGARKVRRAGLGDRIHLDLGDAQALPFEDGSFDGCAIAFGIRNVPDRAQALREMARVTRPGGRIAVLELAEPRRGLLGMVARWYIRRVVPWLGGLLSGMREYRYLQQSIAAFPPPEQFAEQMRESGMAEVAARPLTFGVCTLYVAQPSAVPRARDALERGAGSPLMHEGRSA
jgi:demethylmenaquinone methyltransferase/2-methoxy-6-polyprenyl-1,4-benzoquinol methylase